MDQGVIRTTVGLWLPVAVQWPEQQREGGRSSIAIVETGLPQQGAALRRATVLALWSARASALLLLALGIYIWAGNGDQLITVHVLLGVVLVLSLWTVAAIAARSEVSTGVVGMAVAWSFVAIFLGLTQKGLVTGDWHWTIQVLHLLVAMAMVGWCQLLAIAIARQTRTRV